jgi:hypothetical protein
MVAKPCKLWGKYRNQDGYGIRAHFENGRWRARLVHRLACIEAHGPPPPDKPEAMHLCDTPACYEPTHLRWGSRRDNMGDAARKGRMARGERAPRVTLTAAKVRAIRASRAPLSKLSALYGVSVAQVSRIRLRQQWRHV